MQTGDTMPDFELADQTGTTRRLSSFLEAGPVVLFFYPAATTYGCTKEACHFRDLGADLAAVGAQRVGISADKVDKQRQFADKHALDFPLLSDPDYALSKQLGVRRPVAVLGNRRTTFVIDTDRTILGVVHSEVSMRAHGDRALEILKRRSEPAAG